MIKINSRDNIHLLSCKEVKELLFGLDTLQTYSRRQYTIASWHLQAVKFNALFDRMMDTVTTLFFANIDSPLSARWYQDQKRVFISKGSAMV